MQREVAALVKSWTDHLAQFKGPGASPALCELLEDDGDFVPTGPPLADLLASDVHQLQADALRRAIAETYSLADTYKQVPVVLEFCNWPAGVMCVSHNIGCCPVGVPATAGRGSSVQQQHQHPCHGGCICCPCGFADRGVGRCTGCGVSRRLGRRNT